MVEEVTLRCMLLDNGPNQPFIVRIRVDESVFDLMEKILKSTENRTREYDAQDILLYKLKEPIPVSPSEDLFRHIQNKGDIQSFAVPVEDISKSLSDVFPHGVADRDRNIHFVVNLPPAREILPPRKRTRTDQDSSGKVEAVSSITPSSSKPSGSGSSPVPQPLQAG
ncbi:hypothetical protein K443DRAFT_685209 [Laccaria amethystina LaAM-08-1]|uniref:Crinkler effector protein N-terminal domain-containing protein n=1 Tax=Laccaria amethystina LaAM-08-1 TaxID=1095629 RepID=A0A0C9X4I7_9AGAR|nr:hypothetical protein K443DRAFT_685209 [Laccaria amethystina LaAM-08-1]